MGTLNIVLLCGGAGKRLWPFSNDIRSKQFIKIFRKPGNGDEYESMLQRVYRQIKAVDRSAAVTVATSKSQVSVIRDQIGSDVGMSIEPCRRDTFPAMALTAAYLHDIQGIGEEAAVVVCPVDPYVDDDYFEALKNLAGYAQNGIANLVLMGISPTYPSEKYGYIIPESGDALSKVTAFKEKPDVADAREYIKAGGLWNGGVFAFRLRYMLERVCEMVGFSDYDVLLAKYDTLPRTSFDYAVVEHEKDIAVLRFAGQWKDLGTWDALAEEMGENVVGKGILDEECSNVHIVNETDIPVLAVGLHDMVVSVSSDGILVCDKEKSSRIKPYVDKICQ